MWLSKLGCHSNFRVGAKITIFSDWRKLFFFVGWSLLQRCGSYSTSKFRTASKGPKSPPAWITLKHAYNSNIDKFSSWRLINVSVISHSFQLFKEWKDWRHEYYNQDNKAPVTVSLTLLSLLFFLQFLINMQICRVSQG